jgi:hypothetical protein
MLAYDNVSKLPDWLSDAFCRIATGGALTKRQVFTDQDECILNACQPIMLNGIQDFVAAPDLADRSLFLLLARVGNCIPEKTFWKDFEKARPRILGALLDIMVQGLRKLPEVELPWSPRLADFAKWGTACQGALGKGVDFMSIYAANRGEAAATVIAGNDVASALLKFMEPRAEWQGTATTLLSELNQLVTDKEQKEKGWPKRPNGLSNALRGVAGVLEKVGITIVFDTGSHKRGRQIIIARETVGKTSSPSSRRPQPNETNGCGEDDVLPGDDCLRPPGGQIALWGTTTSSPGDNPPFYNPLKNNDRDDGDSGDDLLQTVYLKDGDYGPFECLKTNFKTNRKLHGQNGHSSGGGDGILDEDGYSGSDLDEVEAEEMDAGETCGACDGLGCPTCRPEQFGLPGVNDPQ